MNVNFRVDVGEYEVVASGVVMTHLDKGIQFHINNLTYDIAFTKDINTDKPKINTSTSSEDPNYLRIELVNYDSNFGRGFVSPVEVGSIGGKPLYFQFMSSNVGNTETKVFEYTWFTKSKENGNEQRQ